MSISKWYYRLNLDDCKETVSNSVKLISISFCICKLTLKIPNEFKGIWAENDFFKFRLNCDHILQWLGIGVFFPKIHSLSPIYYYS